MSEPHLLSFEERDAAFRDFVANADDLHWVTKYASRLCRRYRMRQDALELLSEAAMRVLSQERSAWSSEIPAKVYVGGVVRSIAWEWYQKETRSSKKLQELDNEFQLYAPQLQTAMQPHELSALWHEIMSSMEDDPIAQKIFIGIYEGVEGEELQKECGIPKLEYESKRKKVRRRLAAYLAKK